MYCAEMTRTKCQAMKTESVNIEERFKGQYIHRGIKEWQQKVFFSFKSWLICILFYLYRVGVRKEKLSHKDLLILMLAILLPAKVRLRIRIGYTVISVEE